ncbi:hypothetical protein EBR57_06580 [bacterium]|nr:hypothetical protein [bacterium]
MPSKIVLSAIATCLSIVGFVPYIRTILTGQTRPHVFSWVIWAITTLLVGCGQWAAKGGVGAWPTAVSGLLTVGVAIMAYTRKGDRSILPIDWVFFVIALLAIPIWAVTADPFWSVLILTAVDILGFLPTIRKVYSDPYCENLTTYWILFFRNIVAAAALESYSATTLMFPIAMSATILVMIPLVLVRRLQNR